MKIKKSVKIAIIIILLILENIIFLNVKDFYSEMEHYKDLRNNGLIQACDGLIISDNLFDVLKKMKNFWPDIDTDSGYIILNYGAVRFDGGSIALYFDKNYKLTNKSCDANWVPKTPDLRLE